MRFFAATVGCLLLSALVWAGSRNAPETAGPTPALSGNPVVENVVFNSPHDVIQIRAVSNGANLKIDTRDCCVAGDKWSIRVLDRSNGKVVDVRGTGNGSTTADTGQVTVYKGGSQNIDVIVEVRYAQGVALFAAGMSVRFASPAGASITTTPLTTPVSLPSS